MLHEDPAVQAEVQKAMATYNADDDRKIYQKQLARWQKDVEAAKAAKTRLPRKPVLPAKPGELNGDQQPGYLFKVNIEPYIPYAIKGVLWDQGEAGTAIRGVDQYTLMARADPRLAERVGSGLSSRSSMFKSPAAEDVHWTLTIR